MSKGMNKAKAISMWPDIEFTGGSGIHASLCEGTYFENTYMPMDGPAVIKWVNDHKMYAAIATSLEQRFAGFEWILSVSQVQSLLIADLYRLMMNKPLIQTKDMITNPVTGSNFHLFALIEDQDIVAGIRTFFYEQGGRLFVLYRFRITSLSALNGKIETSLLAEKVREKVRERVVEAEQEMGEIAVYIEKAPTIEQALTEKAIFH